MPGEWHRVTVDNIAEVLGGGTPSTKEPDNFGGIIPWITPTDLSALSGRWISKGERTITEKGLNTSAARILPPKTVLLSTRAPVGYLALAQNEVTTNQGFRSLIVRKEFYPEFVYYLLKNDVERLKSYAVGSTFQELSGSTLKSMDYLIPPLPEQRAIAHILGTLDDKIELNRKTNETLEAMAQAIFKSWFIDFDPVRRNAARAQNQPSPAAARHPLPVGEGHGEGRIEALDALFPDSFQDSELGQIPKGWEVGTIGEEFALTMGQSPPGNTYNENGNGIPFFQGRTDFGFRYPNHRVYCTAPTRFAEAGDSLVSVRAPVGDINVALEKCCVGRGVAAIRHKSGSRSYTYYAMCSLVGIFNDFEAEGTVFGCINKDDFQGIKHVVPFAQLVKKFEATTFPLDQSIENNFVQSAFLTAIRDALLPKLLSGKIRVPSTDNLDEAMT